MIPLLIAGKKMKGMNLGTIKQSIPSNSFGWFRYVAIGIFLLVAWKLIGKKLLGVVDDEEMSSSEKETAEAIDDSYVDDDDLTINHTSAQEKADIIYKELQDAHDYLGVYDEAPIDEALEGLTIADKQLVIKKFGTKKLSAMFQETKILSMKKFALEVLSTNDYKHLSAHFVNNSNFI